MPVRMRKVPKEERMRKGTSIWAMLAVVAGLLALGTSLAAASTTPRWVKHVRSYPGGISGGVRAYLDSGTSSANAGLVATPGASSPSRPASPAALHNLKVNGQDSNPPVPQNETQVVHNEFNDLVAVAG